MSLAVAFAANRPVEKPVEKTEEKPAEKAVEKPAEKSDDREKKPKTIAEIAKTAEPEKKDPQRFLLSGLTPWI